MPSAAWLHFLLLTFAGWVNRRQQDVIVYLVEENRVLREQLDKRRRSDPSAGQMSLLPSQARDPRGKR